MTDRGSIELAVVPKEGVIMSEGETMAEGVTASEDVTMAEDATTAEGGSRTDDRFPQLADAEWLRAQYWDSGWSLAQIAQEVGCTRTGVRLAMIRHGIPRRPPGPAPGSLPPRLSTALRADN